MPLSHRTAIWTGLAGDRRYSGRNRVFTQSLQAARESNGKDARREKGAPAEEARRQAMRGVPLGHFATKDEISNLALFLCMDAAAYITGPICVCNGGQSLLGSRSFVATPGGNTER